MSSQPACAHPSAVAPSTILYIYPVERGNLFTLPPTVVQLSVQPLLPVANMLNASCSIDVVLDHELYIGDLSSALALDVHPELGITHLVSVCPEYASRGPNHLSIPVQDSEYEDLLLHLPKACRFIQAALDQGGKVLVHCVMGISRSATVISAYLMMSRGMSVPQAVSFVKKRRPQVQPNYGFIKQLHAFSACAYEPSRTNPTYRAWKRRHRQDVNCFINSMSDTIAIIPDKLYLSSEFPTDPEQAACIVAYLGLAHLLTISPAHQPPSSLGIKRRPVNVSNKEGLLLALPETCSYIHTALEGGEPVLVHCQLESSAAVVVCAYLMWSRRIPCGQAYKILQDALPLFNRTANFSKYLEIFAACNYSPKIEHPPVQAWLAEERRGESAVARSTSVSAAVASTAAAMSRLVISPSQNMEKASLRAVGTRTRTQIGIMGQS